MEAEHKAALDAQSAAIKAEIVEEAKPDQSTPLAQLREELEQTKQKLSNADTKLLRMAVVESNNTRRQAELEKLKAQIKALEENNGGQGSAGQMSIRGAGTAQPAASLASAGSAMIRPAASGSVSSPAVPGRGRLVARGGVRGGARGGAARGGANQAGQRSNLGPAAILAGEFCLHAAMVGPKLIERSLFLQLLDSDPPIRRSRPTRQRCKVPNDERHRQNRTRRRMNQRE